MNVNLGRYAKSIAFVIGAVVTIGGRALSEHYVSGSAEHWVTNVVSAATLLGTFLGVYGVPNKPQPLSSDLSALDPAILAQASPPFGLHPLASSTPLDFTVTLHDDFSKTLNRISEQASTAANNVQTFTSGVIVPLAVAPESVGNAWDNAVAAYPGLAEKLAKNAVAHKVNSQPMSAEQYAAWIAAGALNLR